MLVHSLIGKIKTYEQQSAEEQLLAACASSSDSKELKDNNEAPLAGRPSLDKPSSLIDCTATVFLSSPLSDAAFASLLDSSSPTTARGCAELAVSLSRAFVGEMNQGMGISLVCRFALLFVVYSSAILHSTYIRPT